MEVPDLPAIGAPDDHAATADVRCRQPLLRGQGRVHPPPATRVQEPRPGVGHPRERPPAPDDPRQGRLAGPQPDLRPDLQARRAAGVLQGKSEQQDLRRTDPVEPRTAPRRLPGQRRSARRHGRAGGRCLLDLPDDRRPLRGSAQDRCRRQRRGPSGLQPLAAGRLGIREPEPDLRRSVHHARRPRRGVRRDRLRLRPRRAHRRDAAGADHHRGRRRAHRATRCSTDSGSG